MVTSYTADYGYLLLSCPNPAPGCCLHHLSPFDFVLTDPHNSAVDFDVAFVECEIIAATSEAADDQRYCEISSS